MILSRALVAVTAVVCGVYDVEGAMLGRSRREMETQRGVYVQNDSGRRIDVLWVNVNADPESTYHSFWFLWIVYELFGIQDQYRRVLLYFVDVLTLRLLHCFACLQKKKDDNDLTLSLWNILYRFPYNPYRLFYI